ncbi:uncharacterized protein LOC126790102 [Argentina anserina]|uniref:uncharacterized protein LOC126790102 n=1 Tax=Argentina anserina TaxID=57926 RepID=UPI0021763593|nr:uncharacterized protein LOC126790102 [Potentilla anserina]
MVFFGSHPPKAFFMGLYSILAACFFNMNDEAFSLVKYEKEVAYIYTWDIYHIHSIPSQMDEAGTLDFLVSIYTCLPLESFRQSCSNFRPPIAKTSMEVNNKLLLSFIE